METTNQKSVMMTQEEAAQFAAFKAEQEKKAAAQRAKEDRDAYKSLVDTTINEAMPILESLSAGIAETKARVLEQFKSALELKHALFKVNTDQRSHTFSNTEGNCRITIGQYMIDSYRDTVNDGIAIVKEYISSLAKDDESATLVQAVLRLMSKDQAGNLKASRVLQLRRMAQESGNERFQEGVRIIEESYAPTLSKQYIRMERKDERGKWLSVPLGMTEAFIGEPNIEQDESN